MRDGSASASLEAPISNTEVITTATLGIIALVAIVTIIAILWGMRLKRERRVAERTERERIEADQAEAERLEGELGKSEPAVERPAEPTPAVVVTPDPATAPIIESAKADPAERDVTAASLDGSPAIDGEVAPVEPVVAEAPVVTPPPEGPDPAEGSVLQLKGLGPKVATRLADLGIATVGQMAAMDSDAATRVDMALGPFTGRMARDRWIEQARLLAAGDVKGFEALFGKL